MFYKKATKELDRDFLRIVMMAYHAASSTLSRKIQDDLPPPAPKQPGSVTPCQDFRLKASMPERNFFDSVKRFLQQVRTATETDFLQESPAHGPARFRLGRIQNPRIPHYSALDPAEMSLLRETVKAQLPDLIESIDKNYDVRMALLEMTPQWAKAEWEERQRRGRLEHLEDQPLPQKEIPPPPPPQESEPKAALG